MKQNISVILAISLMISACGSDSKNDNSPLAKSKEVNQNQKSTEAPSSPHLNIEENQQVSVENLAELDDDDRIGLQSIGIDSSQVIHGEAVGPLAPEIDPARPESALVVKAPFVDEVFVGIQRYVLISIHRNLEIAYQVLRWFRVIN